MSVNSIVIDPSGPLTVTIARADKGQLDINGVISTGEFGIHNGVPYFDSSGATLGEAATLGYDGSRGRFFLTTQPQLETHLLLLRWDSHKVFETFEHDPGPQASRQAVREPETFQMNLAPSVQRQSARAPQAFKFDPRPQARRQRVREPQTFKQSPKARQGRQEGRERLLGWVDPNPGAQNIRYEARASAPTMPVSDDGAQRARERAWRNRPSDVSKDQPSGIGKPARPWHPL